MNIKDKVYSALSVPVEVTGTAKITIEGDFSVFIESYRGLLEYENDRIRIKTSGKEIIITGEGLEIKTLTDEDILITGGIAGVSLC